MPYTPPRTFNASSFSVIKRSMMQSSQLPLADIVCGHLFESAFQQHGVDFGDDEDTVYTPAITLWALISQVFFAAEHRSCKAAVARVAALWATLGRCVCDTNTGAYCRARLKIPFEAVPTIVKQLAQQAESRLVIDDDADVNLSPQVMRDVRGQATAGRIILVDGLTVTAADTPANQDEYPQNPAQLEGIDFPILRCVCLTSLSTGMLLDLACGSYTGKQTDETALLRALLDELHPGDTLVADSYYCTYWLVAECRLRGVRIVMKNHHKRDNHPGDARRLRKGERLVTITRPPWRPWMSAEERSQVPSSLELRLVDVVVNRPGFRTTRFSVATTDLDGASDEWIRSVYRSRWLVELDIRAIKCSLNMDILRSKTPAMVRTELWASLLAYNLIRLKMLQSSIAVGRDPRSLSFSTTQQLLATNWLLCAVIGVTPELAVLGQEMALSERVGHRDGRIEPRVNKRRPKTIALMSKPRRVYKDEMNATI